MIVPYSGGGYKFNSRTFEQVCITLCTGADDQSVGIFCMLLCNQVTRQINDISKGFQHSFQERDFIVGYDFYRDQFSENFNKITLMFPRAIKGPENAVCRKLLI